MKRHILFLVHLPPPVFGPSFINQEIIRSPSLRRHFSIDVLPINTSTQLREVERLSLWKICLFFWKSMLLAGRLIAVRYEFVYMSLTPTGIGFIKDALLACVVKAFKIRIIYHLHGKGISRVRNPFIRALYKACFKDTRVILLSSVLASDIKTYVPRDSIYIVPNGIHNTLSDRFFAGIMHQRKLYAGLVRVAFFSNMVRSKGIFTLLEALKILSDSRCSCIVSFAGKWFDVTENEFNHRVSQFGLTGIVRYEGFKQGKDKGLFLAETDVFVLPTEKDTFPTVLLEAMQYGLPCVSMYEGAIADIIEDGKTGLLVPKHDGPALAGALERLITDPLLRVKIGSAARDKFLRKYTFDKFEARLGSIFDELCKK